MVRMAEFYPDPKSVHALRARLSWTHYRLLLGIEDATRREFYAEMGRVERWSTRTLMKKITGMHFERTELSRKPAAVVSRELKALRATDRMTPDLVFRDPRVLDFLELKDSFSEKDLESAILRELERFLLEFGSDFAFVARQKHISVDNRDYYLDLLPEELTATGRAARTPRRIRCRTRARSAAGGPDLPARRRSRP
jgi:predicted nuclease of restriction endonuclease-like (RecB) superfamily